METISPSQLRQNLAKILDDVAETNTPVMISSPNRAPVYIVAQANVNHSLEKMLFTQTRLQILDMATREDSIIDSAYSFAWYNGVYPLAHDEDDSTITPSHQVFEKHFLTSKNVVDEVSAYIDDCWLNENIPTWYELEAHYSRVVDRWSLIKILRYYFLNGGFDNKLWDKLLTPMQHPSEARGITMNFDIKNHFC